MTHCLLTSTFVYNFCNIIHYFLAFSSSRVSDILVCTVLIFNKAEREFDPLAHAAKPSETQVVHQSGHQSQYKSSPLPLTFSEQTGTQHAAPQFMKVQEPPPPPPPPPPKKKKKRRKKIKMISRSASLARARA